MSKKGPRKDLSGLVFGRWTVLSFSEMRGKGISYWDCVCECGTRRIVSGKTLKSGESCSCGCFHKDTVSKNLTGQRFGNLITQRVIKKVPHDGYVWLCKCDCGNTKDVLSSELTKGSVKSCGCLTTALDLAGQRFGKLVAKRRSHVGRWGSWYWGCLCDCGKEATVRGRSLVCGFTASCGNCGTRINGVLVSQQQKKLAKMIGGQMNYKEGRSYIDVALPDKRIAIEYDGWWWHKNKKERDRERVIELVKKGWRVVSIKSRYEVPTYNTLQKAMIDAVKSGHTEIIMGDWNE